MYQNNNSQKSNAQQNEKLSPSSTSSSSDDEEPKSNDPNSYILTENDIKHILSELSSFSGLITIDDQDYYYSKKFSNSISLTFQSTPQNVQNLEIINNMLESKEITITPENKHFLFQFSLFFKLPELTSKTKDFSQGHQKSYIHTFFIKFSQL